MTLPRIIPNLIDALVVAFAPHAKFVSDGFPLELDPGDWLMVGVDNPFATGPAASASSAQTWPHVTAHSRDEQGSISCAACAWNSDGDMRAAREAVFAMLAGTQEVCRTRDALPVDGLQWVSFTGLSFQQSQDDMGAVAIAAFSIDFRARI